jgi:hypothetical protein
MTVLAEPPSSLSGPWSGQGQQLPRQPSPRMQRASRVRVFLSWRTFALSAPLQRGLWLLRRLRPPSRTLAFSRPAKTGKAAWEFPNSNARDTSAACRCLLYAGRFGDNACRRRDRQAHRHPILGRVYQPLSPVRLHDAINAGSFRHPGPQDWSVGSPWLDAAELLSAGFRPLGLPTPDACCVVLAPLSRYSPLLGAISRAVRGRARLKPGGSGDPPGSPRLSGLATLQHPGPHLTSFQSTQTTRSVGPWAGRWCQGAPLAGWLDGLVRLCLRGRIPPRANPPTRDRAPNRFSAQRDSVAQPPTYSVRKVLGAL